MLHSQLIHTHAGWLMRTQVFFCSSACEWQHILAFLLHILFYLLTFFFFPPSFCLPFPVCPCGQMSVYAWLCVRVCVCSQIEKRKRKACETSEFLWLQPSSLSSSLPLSFSLPIDSSGSDTWINMKVPYFFPFCLRIHTLLTSSGTEAAEGRFSLIRSFSIEHIRACGKKIKCHNRTQIV